MADLKLLLRLDALDKATKPLRNLQGAINSTSKSAAAQRKHLLELQRTLNNAPASRAQFEQMQRIRREMDLTTAAIARQEKQIKMWARTRDARSSGKSMMMKGSMQLAGTAAAVYGINEFMQAGETFDATMSKVQALTRLDKNSKEFMALRENAKELGASTWADPTQVAQGQAFYAMSGFKPDEIIKSMSGTLDLARAGDVDVAVAADIGSNILSAFGIDAGQMDRVGDILVGTFTRTNTNLEMLGETMKYVGPIAKGLGISLEEAAAMTGVLGNVGIQGGEAGTAMRAIFSRLAAGPKMAKKELAKMGIKTTDKKGNMRNPMELLTEMLHKTSKMGNADRLNALTSIAGLEAASALSALIDKGSIDDLQKILKEIQDNNGESKTLAKVMADNLAGDKQKFTSALTDWKIAIHEVNNGGLRDIVQQLTSLMNIIGNWTKENPATIQALSKIAGGALAVSAAIGSIALAMGFLKFAVIGHPIITVLTLAIFLGMQLYDNFDDLVWLWNEGFAFMQRNISGYLGSIQGIGPVFQLVWDVMTSGLGAIKSLVEHVFGLFTDWDGTLLKLQDHWEDLTMNAQRFWNDFKEVGAPIIDWFSSSIEVIMNGLNGIVSIYDSIIGKTDTEMYDRMDIANKTGLTFSEFNNLPESAQLQAMGVNQPFQPRDIPIPSGPKLPNQLMTTQPNQTMNQTNTIIVNGAGDPKAVGDTVLNNLKQSTDGAKLWDAN